MLSTVVFVVLSVIAQSHCLITDIEYSPCEECNRDLCPLMGICGSGVVLDRCDCCPVCGLGEAHLCTLDEDIKPLQLGEGKAAWHGRCGDNLECRIRDDVNQAIVGRQSICQCLLDGQVCGSDNRTYTKCRMDETEELSRGGIALAYDGPCKTSPEIYLRSPTEGLELNMNLYLICEAEGFPKPKIEWTVISLRTGGKAEPLPADDSEVSITNPGAPGPSRVVSYLQITNFQREREGNYQCTATNELGSRTRAAVLVLGHK